MSIKSYEESETLIQTHLADVSSTFHDSFPNYNETVKLYFGNGLSNNTRYFIPKTQCGYICKDVEKVVPKTLSVQKDKSDQFEGHGRLLAN